jgi:hypothetical protein
MFLVAQSSAARPSGNELEVLIDFEVKGVVHNSLRAIVVNGKDDAYPLENLEGQVSINMEYGTTFLIEFQHGGCVSKQLLFNTQVPTDRTEQQRFRTNLVLEVLPDGQDFEYAAPVGYVYYSHTSNGFIYHSDYSKVGEKELLERMEHAKGKFPPKHRATILAVIDKGDQAQASYGTLVRTRRSSAPMIHLTGKRPPVIRSDEMFSFDNRIDSASTTILEQSRVPLISDRKMREVQYSSKLRIIQDVHIHEHGREKLYRRVIHRYGATHYFCQGQSCTEDDYLKGISSQ